MSLLVRGMLISAALSVAACADDKPLLVLDEPVQVADAAPPDPGQTRDGGALDGGSDPRGDASSTPDARVSDAAALEDARAPALDAATGADGSMPARDAAPADDGSAPALDASALPDAALAQDAAVDAAGPHAGADASEPDAAVEPPFTCAGEGVLVRPDELPVTLVEGQVALTIRELAGEALFKLCSVPDDALPSAVTAEGPVGDVLRVQAEGAAFEASLALTIGAALHAELDQGEGRLAPIVPRALVEGGAYTLPDALMDLSRTGVQATLGESGFMYFRHLDVLGPRYALEQAHEQRSYVTGEVVSTGLAVHVVGTPSMVRTVSLSHTGCNAEPLGPNTPAQPSTCGMRASLARPSASLPGGGALQAGSVLDFISGPAAPAFYCQFAGRAEVESKIEFRESDHTVLTVARRGAFDCSLGLDLVAVGDRVPVVRLMHGPLVPSLAHEGVAQPHSEVSVSSDSLLGALSPAGGDGALYRGVTDPARPALAHLTLSGPGNAAEVSWAGEGYGASYRAVQMPSREPGLAPLAAAYFGGAGGVATAAFEGGAMSVSAASTSSLDVRLGPPRAGATELSFTEGAADVVHVRAVLAGDASATDGLVRWVRVSDLPMQHGRRTLTLLSEEQRTSVQQEGLVFARLLVGFYRVAWDESRTSWPGGRVLPIAAGTLLELPADRLGSEPLAPPPCAAVAVDPTTGCTRGLNETLLVATDRKVEMFSPLDGRYLGTLIDAGSSGNGGFLHVEQSTSDHCLYASQQTPDGRGIVRYDHQGVLLDEDPFAIAEGTTPHGLFSYDLQGLQLWLYAREEGGVDLLTDTGFFLDRFDPTLSARGVEVGPQGIFATGKLAGDAMGSIRRLTNDGAGNPLALYFLQNLAGPEQIERDLSDRLNMLVALSEQPAVAAYDAQTGETVRFVDEPFAGSVPVGVYPLLDGRWLVSGRDMGVKVVLPGSHVRTAINTQISDDAAYVSRVCLP